MPSAHDPAEQLAAHAEPFAAREHRAGRLAFERRRVDGAFAGHDEGSAARALVEADQVEHELGAGERARRRARRTPLRARRLHPRPAGRGRAPAPTSRRAAPRAPRPSRGPHPSAGRRHAPRRARRAAGCGTSHATRIGRCLRASRRRRSACPHRRRRSPSHRHRRAATRGLVATTASSSSPSPRLDARSGSRSSARSSGSPIGSRRLDDRRAVGQTQPARRRSARPSGSGRRRRTASRRRATGASTSAVPSPPSATGASSTSTPSTRRIPAASSIAASSGVRTPLRLAGDASASTLRLLLERRLAGFLGRLVHVAQRRVRQPFTREEDEPDADADRRLDRLQPDAERDAVRVRDAVVDERESRPRSARARRCRARAGRSSRR